MMQPCQSDENRNGGCPGGGGGRITRQRAARNAKIAVAVMLLNNSSSLSDSRMITQDFAQLMSPRRARYKMKAPLITSPISALILDDTESVFESEIDQIVHLVKRL